MIEEIVLSESAGEDAASDRYAGVRVLWLKVIVRAIFDWITYRDSTKLMQRKLAENAYTWLFEPSHLFNSFENICYHLGLDPDTVRDRARKMSRSDVAKIEHLERLPLGSPELSATTGDPARDNNEAP